VKERNSLYFTNLFIYDLFSDNNLKYIEFAKSICLVLNRKTEIPKDTSSHQNIKYCFQLKDDYQLKKSAQSSWWKL